MLILRRISSPIGKARDFGKMGLEIMLEPVDERIRLAPDAFGDVRHRGQFETCDLGRVRVRLTMQRAKVDIDELILVHSVVEVCPITGEES